MMTILMMMMTMMIILMAKERELAEESAHDKRPKCQPIGRQLDCRWHYYDHGPWSSMMINMMIYTGSPPESIIVDG